MKRWGAVASLLLALMLSACGDNLLAGGASLGGTGGGSKPGGGTGVDVDEGNGTQNPGNQLPVTEQEIVKYISYTLPVQDNCGVIQRKMYFLDHQGQPVKQLMQEEYGDRVQVKVELTNIASYPVFEKLRDCRTGFELLDAYSTTEPPVSIKPRRRVSCEGDVSWRVFAPQQTQTYMFESADNYLTDDMTEGRIQHFQVEYAPEFLQQPQSGLPSASADTLRCAPLQLRFNTVNRQPQPDDSKGEDPTKSDTPGGIIS